MKILIAADMEGVSGVVKWDHVDSRHAEYARFRKIMTGDVNAAIRGALQGGATEVVVADGHGGSCNILVEELDTRARLNSGGQPPFAMLQGLDEDVRAAMFVGYHARIGAPEAILCHTWSSARVANLWMGGQVVGEIGLNAALCGHYGAPVIMISGDQSACAEATELLGALETAVVKRARGRMAAECLPPEVAQQRIEEAAERAVRRLLAGEAPPPWRPPRPIQVAIEFRDVEMAERAAALPGLRLVDGLRVEFTVEDAPMAYRTFWAAVTVAR